MNRLVIDMDGTICRGTNGTYYRPEPKWDVVDKVNKLFAEGWEVIIFTARGMNTFKGDAQKCDEHHRKGLEEWLAKYKVNYTRLQFGKPAATVYVDDLALRPDEFANGTF